MLTPRACQNAACGRVFLAQARTGRGLYCSRHCASVIKMQRRNALYPPVGCLNGNFKDWASRRPRVYVNRFRAKYPAKAQAHDAVKYALRRGELIKPLHCECCL